MKAYSVTDRELPDDVNSWLVFANDEDEARNVAGNSWGSPSEYWAAFDVNRREGADGFVDSARTIGYVEHDGKAMVAADIVPEGWAECELCGELTGDVKGSEEWTYPCCEGCIDSESEAD